jgi:precorrin-3B synthase
MTICPGIHDLAEMKDGLLARLRLPGGLLSSEKAEIIAELAREYGNGEIDLTNRANLQLRGITADTKPALVTALLDAQLVSKDPIHDRRRNITIDPLSGLNFTQQNELVDCSFFAKAIDAFLKAWPLREQLSPKFSFVLDGGGRTNIAALPHDLAFTAVREPGAESDDYEQQYTLSINGSPTPYAYPESVLIGGIEVTLKKLIALSGEEPLRMKSLIEKKGRAAVIEEIGRFLPISWRASVESKELLKTSPIVQPLRAPLKESNGRYCLPLLAPKGRLTHDQLSALAEINRQYTYGQLRLTPWQGLILAGVKEPEISAVWSRAEAIGLLTKEADQTLTIISCAGASGCIHGVFETKKKALEIRDAIRNKGQQTPRTIHLSACEKGCASREKSDWLIMGKRGSDEISLHNNAAPAKGLVGEKITADTIIPALKKLF